MDSINQPAIPILGIPVNALTESDATNWISRTLDSGGPVTQIVTYNPEYAIEARGNPAFRRALQSAELVTADGIGITLAAKLRRRSLDRVTGVRLLEMLAATGQPLFLLGAGSGVGQAAADRLHVAQPDANIVGTWAGGTPCSKHDVEALARIRESEAAIVAVAYGAPAQVLWIERLRPELTESGVRIAIGVGGALDYWSGLTPTPPSLIRRLGLEWLWRLAREPRRWRRQLALPRFAALAAWEAIRTSESRKKKVERSK